MGSPDLFLAFLDLRAVSERAALWRLDTGKRLVRVNSRSLEEMSSVGRTRHCCYDSVGILPRELGCECLARKWTLEMGGVLEG